MILSDIWYIWILGRHKHHYIRIRDGRVKIEINGELKDITYQKHQCDTCKKIVGLDDWQIADLSTDMLYEKIPKMNLEYIR